MVCQSMVPMDWLIRQDFIEVSSIGTISSIGL
jgi:hypothetical protein